MRIAQHFARHAAHQRILHRTRRGTWCDTGTVAEPEDPLIRTTARIFPGLLEPLEAMPADLRAHIRYPEGSKKSRSAAGWRSGPCDC